MRHENETPAKRRRLVALFTIVVVVLVAVVAAVVVGPGRAIGWVGDYLIPVVVITGVVITSLALLLWALRGIPESTLREWYRNNRYH
jgi:branched-subunit amino acid permease